MNYTQEQLETQFKLLPKELRDVVVSENVSNIIDGLGKKHALHIDQIGELAEEAGLVLLGLTRASDFARNIAKRTGIDMATANALAGEIDTAVFRPIKDSLVAFSEHTRSGQNASAPARMVPVRTDSYRETIDPQETKPFGDDTSSVENLPKREDLLREIEDAPVPAIPRATSIAQAFPQKQQKETLDMPAVPVPAAPAQDAGTEQAPSLVRVGGMTSVPAVKDLIHEKSSVSDNDMIKKKFAGAFSLAPAKTTETKSEKPSAPPIAAPPASEAPRGQGHDPYREPVK